MAVVTAPAPPAAPSDEQLLARFARGDRGALEDLFRRYRGLAYRVAYRLLGHEADALDAVQEGFVKALANLAGFEGRSSFKTWLLRIVSNAALDLGRQRRRRDAYVPEAPAGAEEPALAAKDGEPADHVGHAEFRRRLDAALAALPEGQRRTFVLHVDGELSYREVADAL